MEYSLNKVTQFKQWILSIVKCRNLATSKGIGVTLINNKFNLNYLRVGLINRFGFDIQHNRIHLFDGNSQHSYFIVGFITIMYSIKINCKKNNNLKSI